MEDKFYLPGKHSTKHIFTAPHLVGTYVLFWTFKGCGIKRILSCDFWDVEASTVEMATVKAGGWLWEEIVPAVCESKEEALDRLVTASQPEEVLSKEELIYCGVLPHGL